MPLNASETIQFSKQNQEGKPICRNCPCEIRSIRRSTPNGASIGRYLMHKEYPRNSTPVFHKTCDAHKCSKPEMR